jgi:hypothetical protein
MRFLIRLENENVYTPKDAKPLQSKIRKLLGSSDIAGNLRISSTAIEFDLFDSQTSLEKSKKILETKISPVKTFRAIETRGIARSEDEAFHEGVDLFNEERFWEAHEALEEIWHPATGTKRDTIQGLILTAAALVHYQKNENAVCLSILERALEKLGRINDFQGLDIELLRSSITRILQDNTPKPLRMKWVEMRTTQ